MKTFYLEDIESGVHEYTLEVKEKKCKTVYTLKTSHNSDWTSPGEVVAVVHDSGNGLKFKEICLDGELDYATVDALQAILNGIKDSDRNFCPTYKVLEVINPNKK